MKKIFFWCFLIIILSLPAVWSLFHPGFFTSHDGEWMVIRFTDFHRSLADGQFPVRFVSRLNHGYGYPILNFLYPFSFYFAEIFYFFGFSFINSIKAVFILGFILSGIFMFSWTRRYWGDLGGLASTIVYLYTPYRFLDTFVRGSVGETVAFIFPPLIFWMIDGVKEKYNSLCLVIGAFSVTALITSHNTMAMLFLALITIYIFFSRKNLITLLITIFLGFSLSSFFWLPALLEKKYVIFDKVLVSNFFLHFPSLKQLLIPSWGYGPSLPLSDQDTLSFQIGIVNLAAVLLATIFFFKNKKISKEKEIKFFLLAFLFSFFLMTKYSTLFWRLFPVYKLIQFPWRLLSLTTFSSAFLAGSLIGYLPKKLKNVAVVFLAISLIILTRNYTKPESFVFKDDSYYASNEGTTTVANEYMPIWVKRYPQERAKRKIEVLEGDLEIKRPLIKSNEVNFLTQGEKETLVQINTIYYPGWQVFVDQKKWSFDFENDFGVIRFKLPQGKHKVAVVFKETPLRKMANVISLVSFMLCSGLVLKDYAKKRKAP